LLGLGTQEYTRQSHHYCMCTKCIREVGLLQQGYVQNGETETGSLGGFVEFGIVEMEKGVTPAFYRHKPLMSGTPDLSKSISHLLPPQHSLYTRYIGLLLNSRPVTFSSLCIWSLLCLFCLPKSCSNDHCTHHLFL
jgi:hypothetical protein